jgi:uncharacterized protein (TIGR02246 family)
MRTLPALPRALPVLLLLSLLNAPAEAQTGGLPSDDELFKTIAALDSAVFDAVNRCDLEKVGTFFAEDLEFYHDLGGVTRTRQSLVESVKNNLCGKVRRELVAGTIEVYPMQGYGAVQMGVHRFYHPGRDDQETPGEAKFIHLWQNKDGAWRITRVISYDHHALAKEPRP